jgi:hypothetical protein
MSSIREYREIAASEFIAERASELIYQGKLDEDVLDRFEVLANNILRKEVHSPTRNPLNEFIENLLLEIVRLVRAG